MFEIEFKLRDTYGSWRVETVPAHIVPRPGDLISFDGTSYKVSFISHEIYGSWKGVNVVVFAEQL